VKFSYGKSIPGIATCVAAVLALTSSAQQHASFHAVEYRDKPAGMVRIGGPPVHTLYAPSPRYTKEARRAKIKGTVVLEGTLGLDGCLRDVKAIRILGYGLDESAIETVQRWRFKPFLKNGVPAETKVEGELTFDPAWSSDRSLSSERTCGEK
jgi:TonB family protein